MSPPDEATVRDLEERLRALQEENETLAEQAEDVFLLGKVTQGILGVADVDSILRTLLERIAILKDVAFAGCFCPREDGFAARAGFASFRENLPEGLTVAVPESVAGALRSGAAAPTEGWALPAGSLGFGGTGFVLSGAIAVPFTVRPEPPGLLVVADDRRSGEELAALVPVLVQMVGLATARIENVSLLADLGRMNDELEERVRERTVELQATNARLGTEVDRRRGAEETLRQSATVFDSTSEGVLITDPDLHIVAVNRAFREVTGWTEEEVLGKTPSVLRSGRHGKTFYDGMWASIRETGRWQGEIWNRRKDGGIFPELLTVSAVRDEEGRVTHYAGVFSDISAAKASEARIEHVAHHDPLTGLPNRLLFHSRVEHAVSHARRLSKRTAVLLLDLDRFGSVNETLGHRAGDELLVKVAQRLGLVVRAENTLARLGADEFGLLLDETAQAHDAGLVAERLLSILGEPFLLLGQELFVTASVGIALFPDDGDGHAALLRSAGSALRRSRARGRHGYEFYTSEVTGASLERLALETSLRRALTRDELVLHFQPQLSLATGAVVGLEALVRWRHPERGLLAPAEFLPVAEDAGLMEALDEQVLGAACRQASLWTARGVPALRMAVNISAKQLSRSPLVAVVASSLSETGLDPRLLELEITENVFLEGRRETVRTIEALRELGVAFAIDDFGTGYSSLSRLRGLPVDRLKIDQAFLHRVPGDRADEAVARAVITLGHSLDLKVIAEGVEREEQLAVLRDAGCDEVQGFLLGRPLEPEAVPAFLERNVKSGRPLPA